MPFHTYILASGCNGTLYTGSTNDLTARLYSHEEGLGSAFTAKYGVHILVWYETFATRDEAFKRERQIKEWKRLWKIELIERFNPGWRDFKVDLI